MIDDRRFMIEAIERVLQHPTFGAFDLPMKINVYEPVEFLSVLPDFIPLPPPKRKEKRRNG